MSGIFFELTIIICLAAFFSIIFRFFRQPPILAYILTGILIGPFAQLQFTSGDALRTMSELGITLLLFMVGLEMRLSDLKSVGKVALITGVGQILFTSAIGYAIAIYLGFSWLPALYISVALTFSSTIIIVKLLSDKRDLNSLYGKISVGFLLVQDFVAILALIFLSGFNTGDGASFSALSFIFVILKGVLLFGLILYLSKKVLPHIMDKIAQTPEILFIFSLAWAFGISALVSSPLVGFSIEIGGFLAGLALAASTESFQIVARVRSLRDFFITIFFVILGMNLVFDNIANIWTYAIIFSTFVLVGNPIIVMVIMGFLGYRKRTSFLAGLTVAQISEFSLILILLGSKLGHVSQETVSLVTMVGVITFVASTYMILHGDYLYKILHKHLSIFERFDTKEELVGEIGELKDHVVLIGANRAGRSILSALRDEGENVVVVDFDPDIINELKERGIMSFFGDASDFDIQERAQLHRAKLVISTVSDMEDNLLLLEGLKKNGGGKVKVVVVAQDFSDAKKLYNRGADYVVVPHEIGGQHLAKMIKDDTLDKIDGRKSSKELAKKA